MLNNWINAHDLRRLWEIIAQGGLCRILQKINRSAERRIQQAWEHPREAALHFWSIPLLLKRWNSIVSGDENIDHVAHIHDKFLAGRRELTAFSPCCGGGGSELRWASTGLFARIDACDLSRPRIASARAKAEEQGLSAVVRFTVSDWRLAPGPDLYDLVIADGALHHMYPMRPAIERIHGMLKPGGLLILNDFVGPSRLQWTERQLQAANAFLAMIPANYRQLLRGGDLKKRVDAPGRLRMKLSDPSEAAESSLILPLLHERFTPLEMKAKGGALVALVFHGIAHHYLKPDETAAAILRLCFETEDLLMASGQIASDYVFGVFKKPKPE